MCSGVEPSAAVWHPYQGHGAAYCSPCRVLTGTRVLTCHLLACIHAGTGVYLCMHAAERQTVTLERINLQAQLCLITHRRLCLIKHAGVRDDACQGYVPALLGPSSRTTESVVMSAVPASCAGVTCLLVAMQGCMPCSACLFLMHYVGHCSPCKASHGNENGLVAYSSQANVIQHTQVTSSSSTAPAM